MHLNRLFIFVVLLLGCVASMPPKMQAFSYPRDRYSTEPRSSLKVTSNFQGKATSMAKNFGRKILDVKRYTVSNGNDKFLYKFHETQGNSFLSTGKKKSFIVSKRKNNRSMLAETQNVCNNKNANKYFNSWIQSIQSESYDGLRGYNEDRIFIKQNAVLFGENVSIFAIFDGHGGSSAAQFLKINFIKSFQTHCQTFNIEQSLKQSMKQLEQKIMQNGHKISSGSCASILVLKQNQYWIANVGDSRILVIKGIEQFIQLTQDHKPENPKEYKRIESLGGKVYRNVVVNEDTGEKNYGPFRIFPSKLSVSRAIGDFNIKKNQTQNIISSQPDIFSGKINYNDVILIMSDGGYQQFSNCELSILFSHQTKEPLKQRLHNYLGQVKKRNTNDNTSIIGIQILRKCAKKQISEDARSKTEFSHIQIQI